MSRFFKYSLTFLPFVFAAELLAQNFSLSGTVSDAASGESLPGATIVIENTVLGAVSDNKGFFQIQNIPLKTVTLRITALGYEVEIIRHDFEKNAAPEFRILLKTNSVALSQVEITGKAEGQIRAMLEQKKAENIKNIVSAEHECRRGDAAYPGHHAPARPGRRPFCATARHPARTDQFQHQRRANSFPARRCALHRHGHHSSRPD